MLENEQACRSGVLYAQTPRVLLNAESLKGMSLYSRAFLGGMDLGNRCTEGAVPTL